MKEVYPWRDLEWEEYWRWNRCVGNEVGYRRQGNLVPTLEAVGIWLLNPYVFESWVVSFLVAVQQEIPMLTSIPRGSPS